VTPWTAQTNTLIINNLSNGEQFWWRYADDEAATDTSISKKKEGAGIKPNAGAGKASDTDSLMAVDALMQPHGGGTISPQFFFFLPSRPTFLEIPGHLGSCPL